MSQGCNVSFRQLRTSSRKCWGSLVPKADIKITDVAQAPSSSPAIVLMREIVVPGRSIELTFSKLRQRDRLELQG